MTNANSELKETPVIVKPTRVVEYYQQGNGQWYWYVRNIKSKKIVIIGAESCVSAKAVLKVIKAETKNWIPHTFIGPNQTIC